MRAANPSPAAIAGLDAALQEKWGRLQALLEGLGSLAVAFSGGVDSALVCAAAWYTLGEHMHAVTVRSPVEPPGDNDAARQVAGLLGFSHQVVEFDDLQDPAFSANPPERCYVCKLNRLRAIREIARARGLAWVADGSNADDGDDYRPGMRALAELGVRSPLAEIGLSKAETRALAHALGLPVWDRPSAPCLATRFPYGTPITYADLRRVGAAEAYLHARGFQPVRVRFYGEMARLEVAPEAMAALLEQRTELVAYFKTLGFLYVALDLAGYRRGSLNEVLTR